MDTTTLTNNHKTTSREVGNPTSPLVVKYTTHLPQDVIKWVKRQALDRDMKDYQVMQFALESFRRNQGDAA